VNIEGKQQPYKHEKSSRQRMEKGNRTIKSGFKKLHALRQLRTIEKIAVRTQPVKRRPVARAAQKGRFLC